MFHRSSPTWLEKKDQTASFGQKQCFLSGNCKFLHSIQILSIQKETLFSLFLEFARLAGHLSAFGGASEHLSGSGLSLIQPLLLSK